jgi:hypothetical protein
MMSPIFALNESGVCSEDVIWKALELYKAIEHPKNAYFMFIHCWLFFKDTCTLVGINKIRIKKLHAHEEA